MKISEYFRDIIEDDLKPFGMMPEGIPRILPPFGKYKRFKVADQFTYISRTGIVVQSKADTLTDLASVPFPFRSLLKIPGRESAGAVVHDEGYSHPFQPRFNIITYRWELLSKRDWDRMFDEVNKWAGVSRMKRGCLNFGLRVGGWIGWRKNSKLNPSTLNISIMDLQEIRNEDSRTDCR